MKKGKGAGEQRKWVCVAHKFELERDQWEQIYTSPGSQKRD
jgi:hypothetical protein